MRYQTKVLWVQKLFYACILLIIIFIFWRFPWQNSRTSRISRTGFSYQYIDDWVHNYPACLGEKQSPMDLMRSYVNWTDEHNNTFPPLVMSNFDEFPVITKLMNIGYTLRISFEWGLNTPSITGGILPGKYQLDSIIFHWDSKSDEGSEHQIAVKRSPLEMQTVFYNANYRSYQNAKNFDDGVAIIADLFSFEPRYYEKVPIDGINIILKKIFDVQNPGSSVNLQPFPINRLRQFGDNDHNYFMYYGSLTMPPCKENVIWVINGHEYYISKQQMEDIQQAVYFRNGDIHNRRPFQPVNGRFLYVVKK